MSMIQEQTGATNVNSQILLKTGNANMKASSTKRTFRLVASYIAIPIILNYNAPLLLLWVTVVVPNQ